MMADSNSKRPTLRDVAQEAGVSHMTVSRVVRGVKNISKETRQCVEEAIERVGYRPDPALSALAHYRTADGGSGDGSVLVFLDCDQTQYSQQVFAGAQAEAQRFGYLVERQVTPEQADQQRQLDRRLYHRGVRGLMFGPSDDEWEFQHWSWPEYATVSLGALSHRPAMHAVAADYFHASFSAVRRLREVGAKRIGFAVNEALEARTGHRWRGGYLAALAGARAYECKTAVSEDGFKAWIQQQRLDGLLTIHPELAHIWLGRADRLMLLNSTQSHSGPWFRLSFNPAQIGQEGVRLLHHLLLRREYGLPESPRMVTLRGVWMGETHRAS